MYRTRYKDEDIIESSIVYCVPYRCSDVYTDMVNTENNKVACKAIDRLKIIRVNFWR